MGKKKKRVKRGYPMGFLIGFLHMYVVYYDIYSERVELRKKLKLPRKYDNMDKAQKYRLFEDIVNEIRPILHSGIKSLLLVSEPKKNEAQDFMQHLQKHHKWMLNPQHQNAASVQVLSGDISDFEKITIFFQKPEVQAALGQINEEEADRILQTLEKRLNDADEGLTLHSLKEIEDLIYAGGTRKKKFKKLPLNPEYILITNEFMENSPYKARIQRLLQIAQNRNIKTKVIEAETAAGSRVNDLGGIVCFLEAKTHYEKQKREEFLEKR